MHTIAGTPCRATRVALHVSRHTWHGRFATRFARIDSRESFAIETPIFIARQADSHESLEFPIRANHPIRANRANRFARITPLRSQLISWIFTAFCRCSTGVALHPLKILVSHLPPPVPGGVALEFGSEKVWRYTGVSQLQLRVSRYTVQLSNREMTTLPESCNDRECATTMKWQVKNSTIPAEGA